MVHALYVRQKMKIPLSRAILVVGTIAFLHSCQSYVIVSPATIVATRPIAEVQADNRTMRVDLAPVKDAFANGTWHSEAFLDKGSYRLGFKDSPDVYVSIYGAFFWIEGQRGFYKVRANESEAFEAFFKNLRERRKIQWKANHR